MLDVRLRHAFPSFRLDAEFAAPHGVTALFGPSGSGKSTVLGCIAGLLQPDEGRVALDGAVLLDTAAGVAVPAERRRCGVVFQDAALFPHLSVMTNLRYGLRRAPKGPGPALDEVVDLLGIGGLLARRPGTLSGGERQRVALGRALLSRPRLLLLDEPLAALDAPRRAELLPFLARARERFSLPMLYVTHALDEVDRLADWLVLIEAGHVLASGSVEDLALRTDLPLAARRDAGAVLRCTVLAHEPARHLTRLGFPGGALIVPLQPSAIGTPLRVRVRARDVAIAVVRPDHLSVQNVRPDHLSVQNVRPDHLSVQNVRPDHLSVQNVLPATLAAIEPGTAHDVIVRLRVGETALLSRVTIDAVSRLGLQPGQAVSALIKSVTLGAVEL